MQHADLDSYPPLIPLFVSQMSIYNEWLILCSRRYMFSTSC